MLQRKRYGPILEQIHTWWNSLRDVLAFEVFGPVKILRPQTVRRRTGVPGLAPEQSKVRF